jgi:hypothetical protein
VASSSRKTKKPRLTRRRGDKTIALRFSFFPKPMTLELDLAPVTETKFGRLPWCHRASPSTTLYESVKSTDTDRMMYCYKMSNGIFIFVKWNWEKLFSGGEQVVFPELKRVDFVDFICEYRSRNFFVNFS